MIARISQFVLLILAALASVHAQAVTTTTYKIASGTGFVLNNDGDIITNHHVVKQCRSISILTARGEENATLAAYDEERDLAVLKTRYIPPHYAPLRWNMDNLVVGTQVYVIGYPGREGAYGRELVKKSRVISLDGPVSEPQYIELESVVAHGNSGGPVLDASGNVIGVVKAISYTYRVDAAGQPTGEPVGHSDVAIALPVLQAFLHENRINFYTAKSGDIGFSDRSLHEKVARFIVPVRCIESIETH